MKIFAYIQEELVSLCIHAGAIGIMAFLLSFLTDNWQIICLILAFYVLAIISSFVLRYVQRHSFYSKMAEYIEFGTEEELCQLSSLITEPQLPSTRLMWRLIDAMTSALQQKLKREHDQQLNYRDYVETWVHEAKTPIAASRLLLDNNPSQISERLNRELDQIDSYVDQSLYYAKLSTVNLDYAIKPLNLYSLVQDVLSSQKRLLIDVHAKINLDESLHELVFSDQKWLSFILVQIIQNAIKYRKDQLILSFSASRKDRDRASERVILCVADNGIGIAPQDLPRVFDKGFVGQNGRTTSAKKSTGLGLYLAKSLCKAMGHDIWISSNHGCEVYISIPCEKSHYLTEL